MMHITVALPDEVAQQYYNASEKLEKALQLGTTPDAQTVDPAVAPRICPLIPTVPHNPNPNTHPPTILIRHMLLTPFFHQSVSA